MVSVKTTYAVILSHAYSLTFLRRNALPITETELRLIAAAAMIGDNNKPKKGYKTPAATGTPREL